MFLSIFFYLVTFNTTFRHYHSLFSLFQKVHYIACDVSGQYSDVQKAVDKVRISFKALKYQYTVLLRSYKNLKTHFASTVKASCNFAPCIDTCLN